MEEDGYKVELQYRLSSQTNGQTEVTNQTLSTLLRVLIKLESRACDLLLPNLEFAYNKAPNRATRISPFKVVYGIDLIDPLYLVQDH